MPLGPSRPEELPAFLAFYVRGLNDHQRPDNHLFDLGGRDTMGVDVANVVNVPIETEKAI